MLKIIALLSAAIPLILFVRTLLGRRPSKFGSAWREAKKQIDVGINIFLGVVGCVIAVAVARLIWVWWMTP
jgi:hypothetical protein